MTAARVFAVPVALAAALLGVFWDHWLSLGVACWLVLAAVVLLDESRPRPGRLDGLGAAPAVLRVACCTALLTGCVVLFALETYLDAHRPWSIAALLRLL